MKEEVSLTILRKRLKNIYEEVKGQKTKTLYLLLAEFSSDSSSTLTKHSQRYFAERFLIKTLVSRYLRLVSLNKNGILDLIVKDALEHLKKPKAQVFKVKLVEYYGFYSYNLIFFLDDVVVSVSPFKTVKMLNVSLVFNNKLYYHRSIDYYLKKANLPLTVKTLNLKTYMVKVKPKTKLHHNTFKRLKRILTKQAKKRKFLS